MYNNDYLEKILGEQYNMSDYFADTYTEPFINIIGTTKNVNNNETSKIVHYDKVDNEKVENDELSKRKYQFNNTKSKDELNVNNLSDIVDEKEDEKENEIETIDTKNNRKNLNRIIKDEHQYEAVQVSAKSNSRMGELDINKMYPEIYKIIEPIVDIVVKKYLDESFDEKLINIMTNRIYLAVESEINNVSNDNNGGNITVNSRINNDILRDLIKILVLNNLVNNKQGKKHLCSNCRNVSNNISYQDVPFPEDE